jgi:hypothetical protein
VYSVEQEKDLDGNGLIFIRQFPASSRIFVEPRFSLFWTRAYLPNPRNPR